ncbi:unnamed protein product [Rotaria sp. Silwood1]|nr:unnamed protein product [Rotaria sp. Silwood1]CAF1616405.1 unnamed protein product [Rotaria sp. Silwood1]CAF3714656.1 unnamed protein product [Rotaria sp. Silwood1]CAF3724909.1 unnamed protein product [Rotaria sp. Silwood1]CAF3739189.1 unnamed protein product [Rotaria sp. Silwood1]
MASVCIQCLNIHLRDFLLFGPSTAIPQPGMSIFPHGVYYFFKDYEDMDFSEIEKEKYGALIGLSDFRFYNLMVLLVLHPLPTIEMKICIGIGCIVFIEIGYMLTIWIGPRMEFGNGNKSRPCLPLPVIAFSVYFVLIDGFIVDLNPNVCQYSKAFNLSLIEN